MITDNGKAIGQYIEVELKELLNQQELLSTNAQTVSNGKLLISGGAYYINLTSDGNQLKLKKGKSLSIDFPKQTNIAMELFYGQRDTLGQMNWQQAQNKFENLPKPKTLIKESIDTLLLEEDDRDIDKIINYTISEKDKKLSRKQKKQIAKQKKIATYSDLVYKTIAINKLGWINCDKFIEEKNLTNLQYVFSEKDDIKNARIYLVFKDINSVMQNFYFKSDEKEFNSGFENIPIGSKTKLIAFTIKNGKIFSNQSDLTIQANKTIQLKLIETTKQEFDKLFKIN